MSENLISSISSVRPADAGTNMSPIGGSSQTDLAGPRLLGSVKAVPSTLRTATPGSQASSQSAVPKAGAPALPEQPEPRQKAPVTNGGSVEVHFRVDRQTKNITVFIVDRESKRVIRSIPPEELNKLQPGDLVEMTG